MIFGQNKQCELKSHLPGLYVSQSIFNSFSRSSVFTLSHHLQSKAHPKNTPEPGLLCICLVRTTHIEYLNVQKSKQNPKTTPSKSYTKSNLSANGMIYGEADHAVYFLTNSWMKLETLHPNKSLVRYKAYITSTLLPLTALISRAEIKTTPHPT